MAQPPAASEEFVDIYYQEYRSQGTLVYTGQDLVEEAYTTDGYPGRDSTSYEYITYNEPFSVRTIVFYVPLSYFRK